MRRLVTLLALLAATTLVISACSKPSEVPQPPATTALDMTDGVATVYSGSLAAGRSAQFSLDGADASDPLIVIELDANLDLRLLDRKDGLTVATSSSPGFFAAGSAGLGVALAGGSGSLDGSAIVTTAPCRGSCIVITASTDTRYFTVTNSGAGAASYGIYLYDSIFRDTNEDGNNTIGGAVSYEPSATTNEGAIEVIGDADWWFVENTAEIDFDTGGDVGIVAYRHTADGTQVAGPYLNGQMLLVPAGQYLRVVSSSSRAGRGATANYFLTAHVEVVPLAPSSAR